MASFTNMQSPCSQKLYQFLCCVKPAGESITEIMLVLGCHLAALLAVMPSPSDLILHLM